MKSLYNKKQQQPKKIEIIEKEKEEKKEIMKMRYIANNPLMNNVISSDHHRITPLTKFEYIY